MTRPNKSVDAGVLSSDLTGMMMAAADSQPEDSGIDGLCLQYDEVQESRYTNMPSSLSTTFLKSKFDTFSVSDLAGLHEFEWRGALLPRFSIADYAVGKSFRVL
jgi:hypothetical protein